MQSLVFSELYVFYVSANTRDILTSAELLDSMLREKWYDGRVKIGNAPVYVLII